MYTYANNMLVGIVLAVVTAAAPVWAAEERTEIVAIVAGTCLPAVLLLLVCAITGMRRFGALGLWLCGWGLVFVHVKQGFVMLHPPAAEGRRVEAAARGKDSAPIVTPLIRSGRTVYAFRPERAPRDALDRALNAARWAQRTDPTRSPKARRGDSPHPGAHCLRHRRGKQCRSGARQHPRRTGGHRPTPRPRPPGMLALKHPW
jgi:hypothetical protein